MSDLDRNFHGGRGRKLGKGDKPDDAARLQDIYDIFSSCFATVKGQTVYMGGGGFPSGGGGAPGPQGGFGPVGPQGAQGPQGPSGSGTGGNQTVVSALGVSTGGNTLGNTGITEGTIVLAGLGAVTLSQATAPGFQATITINVPVQSLQPAVSGIGVSTFGNTAGTTGTTQGTYVLVGGNQITLSQSTDVNGGTVTIVGRDAIFGAGISTGGNTLGTSGTVTGTLVLAGIGNVTLSQSTNAGGVTISISVATATATANVTAVSAIGVSTGGNTAGNTGTTIGTVVLAGINHITLSQSTAAGSQATISISGQDAIFGAGVSSGGNTSGTTGTVTGTLVLAGGNHITLSQSTNASGATITVSGQDGIFGAGVSTGGNTSGTTGTVTGTLVLAGGNQITLSQSTNASGATITISGANSATVVSGIGVSTGGNTAGNTGTTLGTVVFAGINHITLSQSTAAGSQATISISGQDAIFGAGISTGGNTSGTSGTVTGTLVLAGIGNITLSQSTNAGGATISISGGTAAAVTAVSAIGVSTGGNTAGNTGTTIGTYVLAGGNQITLSQSTAAGSIATVTISGRDAIFGAGVSSGGNTSGTTGTVTGTLVLAGGNNVTLSQSTNASGATITFSAANSATVVSGIGVSTGGNTAGNTGTTLGTVVFAGINHITLSQSTAAGSLATISISGQDAIFGAGISTGGNTSGTSGTVTGTLVLAGIGNITLSQSTNAGGATITISGGSAAAVTAVSAIGVSTGGNTSGDTGTTIGTYVLAGGNNITLSQSTAAGSLATVTISGRDAIFGAGVSTGGNTSGTTGTVTGTLVLAGGNQITLSQSTNASGATITVSGANSATVVSGIGVSTGGNTAGNTGTTLGTVVFAGINHITLSQSTAAGSLATITISGQDAIFGAGISTGGNTSGTSGTVTGTLVLAGIGNITLSQSTNASGATISISGSNAGVTAVSAIGVSTGGNTSGDTGTTIGTVVFAGINHITLSQSTAAGSLATITISGQDAIFGAGISTGGNTSGTSGTVTGTLVLAGGNQITLSQSTNTGGATITVSARDAIFGAGVSTGGNTSGTTGTVTGTLVLAGIGNITLSQSTNASGATISISGGTAAAVTAVSAIGVSTGGNTAGNTGTTIGTYVLAGGNQITLSQSTAAGSLATVTISGRDAIFGAGISTGGNTSGTSGTVTGTLVLAGINNITLSQSTNASGATISISGANAVLGLGVSTGGNTSGNTGTTFGTVVLAGGNNITLSQSTAAGSLATITISAANAVFGAGISTGGNTSGTSGTNTGTFVLVGINGITLSQATGAGGNTVTISGNQTNLKLFSHNADWQSNFTVLNATLSLMRVTYPQYMTGTRFEVIMDLTGNSQSSGALTMSIGWYTMSGSTASLATSGSRQISWTSGSATTASTVYGGVSGTRYRTLGLNVTLTPGDYLVGVHFITTNNGTWRIFGRQAMSLVGALDANETNVFLDGTSVSSFTTAMPASINVTDTNYARTGGSALRQAGFILAGSL